MFNVSLTCGRNSSQSWRGQSILHINSGKGANEVFLECGNGMLSGICSVVVGGASWMLTALKQMYVLTAVEHLLSITFSAGW